jgi:hypothetical protein
MAAFAMTLIPATLASAQINQQVCWNNDAIRAAQVRELHVMLMTVSLRCRVINPDIIANYDKFLAQQKLGIAEAETKLKAHFGFARGNEGRARFERFHTGLANFYGVGKTDAQSCAMFDVVTRELGKSNANSVTMAKLAEDIVPNPQIDAPQCSGPPEKKP